MKRSLPALLLALSLSGCSGLAPQPEATVGVAQAALAGGHNDDDSLEANVVVSLQKNISADTGVACTGTLITPTIVLTANHCITGAIKPVLIGKNDVEPGMGRQPDVRLGAQSAHFSGDNAITSTTSLVMHDEPIQEYHGGQDLALVFLSKPVLDKAKIVRPSLTSPALRGDDDDGGTYVGPIGMCGWSPISADDDDERDPNFEANRQAAIFNSIDLDHLAEEPGGDVPGQTWRHSRHGVSLRPGDSGGPLFRVRPDGTRDVFGVANGMWWDLDSNIFTGYDRWTDVTRGLPRAFVLNNVEDHGHKTDSRWFRMHPAMEPGAGDKWQPRTDGSSRWIGEHDYTGACQLAFDKDCDHWYDEHDNCPSLANDDQADQDDDGIGDVCPGSPPSQFPQNCHPWVSCGNSVELRCDNLQESVVLERRATLSDPPVVVASDLDLPRFHIPFLVDNQAIAAFYNACSRNRWGDTCSPTWQFITPDPTACGGGGGGGDTGPRRCQPGQVCRPIQFE